MIRYIKYLALIGLINGLVYAKKPSPCIPDHVQHTTTNATQEINQIALDADDVQTKKILSTFLAMISNFACIVANPNNPQNVGAQLTQLFAGMVAIAIEVTQKKNIPFDIDPIDLSFDLSQDDIEAIKAQLIDILKQLQIRES